MVDKETQKTLLIIFPSSLLTVYTLIFTIPGILQKNEKEIYHSKKTIVSLYSLSFLPCIIFPLLTLTNTIFPFNSINFRISFILFLICVTDVIPTYIVLFVYRNNKSIIKSIEQSIQLKINPLFNMMNKEGKEDVLEKLNLIERITYQSIFDRDYNTFYTGVNSLKLISMNILKSNKVKKEFKKYIIKEIFKKMKGLSIKCGENCLEGLMRDTSIKLLEISDLSIEIEGEKILEYPILCDILKDISFWAMKFEYYDIVDELLEYYNKLGEDLSKDIQHIEHPPINEIFSSILSIGIRAAENKIDTLSIDCLNRILLLEEIRFSNEEKKREKVYLNVWILCAMINHYLPELSDTLTIRRNPKKLSKEKMEKYKNISLKQLESTNLIHKSILKDYE